MLARGLLLLLLARPARTANPVGRARSSPPTAGRLPTAGAAAAAGAAAPAGAGGGASLTCPSPDQLINSAAAGAQADMLHLQGTAGADGSSGAGALRPPPLCRHEDQGTCGNACCTVQAVGPAGCNSECTFKLLANLLAGGGSDGSLRLVNRTAVPRGRFRYESLDFLVVGEHHNGDGRQQRMLFSIGPTDVTEGQALVKGFSESKMVGAYRDFGQNFRNLAEMFNGMGKGWEGRVMLSGCGRTGLLQQPHAVLIIGAGTLGVVIGAIIAVTIALCLIGSGNGDAARRRRRRRKPGSVN